jgi:RNA recognition motif-containing protein
MSSRVFVGNLDFSVSDQYLASVFRGCEGFESAHAAIDAKTGRPFGFGHVDFENRRCAAKAVAIFDGHKLLGRELRVHLARRRSGRRYRRRRDSARSARVLPSVVLWLSCALGLLAQSPTPGARHSIPPDLAGRAKINLQEARLIALGSSGPGARIESEELKQEKEDLTYWFDLKVGEKHKRVGIDAMEGTIRGASGSGQLTREEKLSKTTDPPKVRKKRSRPRSGRHRGQRIEGANGFARTLRKGFGCRG